MKRVFTYFFFLFVGTAIAQNTTQTIKGQIIDEASRIPIPGVNIVVLNTEPLKGGSTDIDGKFRIEEVELGRYSLKISMLGYEDKYLNDVIVTAGKEVFLNVTLLESIETLQEVEVVYDRSKDKKNVNNEMATVSSRSFNIDETKKYAGAVGDPSRMASNFAGVVSGNDSRNDIVVRGNSPLGMLWQLEGLNIPNPNHFGALASTGGPVSMLNNNNLDKSDFLTSAFPAQYGNALAGVFDLRLRNGNLDKHEFLGQIGFNGFEGGVEGPIGKKKKASYLINYRYSTLGVFQKLGINFGTGSSTPIYQDVNFKIFSEVGKRGKMAVFGIAGNSSIEFLGNEIDTSEVDLYGDPYSNIRVNYATFISGAYYERYFGKNTTARITLGYSSTRESFDGDSISRLSREAFPSGASRMGTEKYSAVFSLNHKLSSKDLIVGGVYADILGFDLMNKDIINGSVEKYWVDQKGEVFLGQAYLQWKHRFSKGLTAVAGVHSQVLDLNNSYSVGPRASLKWTINPSHALSAGYGFHSQMPLIYTYFIETPTVNGSVQTNKNLGFLKSHHSVISHDWSISEHMRIKTEAYYQYLFDVPVEMTASSYSALNSGADFAPDNADSLVNNGTGNNYGLELTVEHFFHKGFYFLITGSLFDSRYSGSDGVERNTAFNTKTVLNVLGGKEWKLGKKGSVISFNIRSSWVGGRYLTPLDLQVSQLAGAPVFQTDLAYSNRQKDYFRTDIKIAVRQEFKKATMEFSIDLQNVTNHQNVFRRSYDPVNNKETIEYQQGFFPVPIFRLTF